MPCEQSKELWVPVVPGDLAVSLKEVLVIEEPGHL